MSKKWSIANLWKGKSMPPAIRKKISERAKERYKKREIWNKNRKWTKEERKNISEGKKAAFKKNPELLKKMSRITKERWKNPEFLRKMSKISKERWKNPELRKLVDRKCTEFWKSHPNLKKQYSIKFKQYYRTHPEALKALLNYGKKPTEPHLKTKQGFKVRSKGEQEIANFLCKNKILCLYESIPLMFKELICIPDFYLPSFNLFIEFYGGHPRAWKKKVAKNILYKRHKIPVIGITPAELNNLDYYLKKDANKLHNSKLCRNFDIHKWLKKNKV